MTQDTGRPPVLSHQDFVSEVRRLGFIPVTVETFVAYQFAASYSKKLVWLITGLCSGFSHRPLCPSQSLFLHLFCAIGESYWRYQRQFIGPPGIYGLRSYRLPDFQKRWRRDDASQAERYMWRRTRGRRIGNRLHSFWISLLWQDFAIHGLCLDGARRGF